MRTTIVLVFFALLPPATTIPTSAQNNSVLLSSSSLILPANSQIPMQLTRPVWAARAKAGDLFYAETADPFTVANNVAVPSGTYVEGTITSFTKPGKAPSATFHLQFNKLIFPNGYTVVLTKPNVRAKVKVKVASNNDLLLDNGAKLTMTVPSALALDAAAVAQSIALAQAPDPAVFVPATLCRFIPGTPGDPGSPGSSGTPDITIPGNPGTPDTVIPGSGGAPDMVIPGIPATPDTIIPGTPATPPTPPTPPTDPIYCPDPPAVISSVLEKGSHANVAKTSAAHSLVLTK
jgi:hypothetical protein